MNNECKMWMSPGCRPDRPAPVAVYASSLIIVIKQEQL